MQVASDDCNPTAIVTTTVFRTTNVSVVAPFFANLGIDFSSEVEEDLILTVERYVHVICFTMPVPACSAVLILSGPAFGIHFSLIPNSPQVTFDVEKLNPFIHFLLPCTHPTSAPCKPTFCILSADTYLVL